MARRYPTFTRFVGIEGTSDVVGLSLITTDGNDDTLEITNGSIWDASGAVVSGVPLPGSCEFYITENRQKVRVLNAGTNRQVLVTTVHKGASR